ncbi:hypothetical protein Hanom_Chr09g00845391 [Helianthus anomalus]
MEIMQRRERGGGGSTIFDNQKEGMEVGCVWKINNKEGEELLKVYKIGFDPI